MKTIQKLPQYLINRLKAGEIVERPVSVVKELIENSLDAGATVLDISIEQGGKQLIKVADNGSGMSKQDLPLAIERYATSKILDEQDLQQILSYGFRGEALATISEVSGFRIQTKDAHASVGHELWRDDAHFTIKDIAFGEEQGTRVYVSDIFHVIPAREKFLKTDATEWKYIKQLVIQYALIHRDKQRMLTHNTKQVFYLKAAESLLQRVLELTKDDRASHFKPLERKDEHLHIYGLIGDAYLHFPRGDWIHICVNGRPVEDRVIKRAIMDAYKRQIVPGTYPFAILFVDIDPTLVDVNVHPRKQQVKFLDPGSIFTRVQQTIQQMIGDEQVNYAAFTKDPIQHGSRGVSHKNAFAGPWKQSDASSHRVQYGVGHQQNLSLDHGSLITAGEERSADTSLQLDHEPVKIVGQLWQRYILLEGATSLYRVDQHALAERIMFEKMKKELATHGFQAEHLLQPITMHFPRQIDIQQKIDQLAQYGFDIALFSEDKIIIYTVPNVFVTYKMDIELIMQWVRDADIDDDDDFFALLFDEIIGMKACKASIKAGQKLSILEMQRLLEDAVKHIEGLFVCQHGRPAVVAVSKTDIDTLFDR